MILTWMLWNALRSPQWKHPIFQQIQQQKVAAKPLAWYWRLLLAVLFLFVLASLALFPLPALLSILGLAVGIPSFVLVFNGTVLGLYWVGAIAEAIARENRQGRFELLSLTPDGSFGISWRLAVASIHRHDWLNTVYRLLRGVILGVLFILAFLVLTLIMGAVFAELSPQREGQIRIMLDVLVIGLVILFFWADHIQSIVLALLVGLILPYFQQDEGLLKVLAPLSFLFLQAINYLVGLSIFSLRLMFENLPFLLFVVSAFVFYCGIREILIRGLWRLYLRLAQSSEEESQIVRA